MMTNTDKGDINEDDAIDKKQQKKNRELSLRLDNALISIMNTLEGRYFIWDILERSRVFHMSVNENPYFTYFNEGIRSTGNMLFADIMRVAEDQYFLMVKENGKK